jgi:hypothetical protein
MWHWFETLLRALFAIAVINVILVVVQQGQLYLILLQRRVRKTLSRIPSSTLLTCQQGAVAVVHYNERTGLDDVVSLYNSKLMLTRSSMTWKGGYRSAGVLRKKLGRELVVRCAIFSLVCVPAFVYAAWLTVEVHWSAVFYLVALGIAMRLQLLIMALHGTLLSFALLFATHKTFFPLL